MPNLTPEHQARFNAYVADAEHSTENLSFLFDNLDDCSIALDYSVASLEAVERIFWQFVKAGVPDHLAEVANLENFAALIAQYLGECVIQHTGGSWVQSTESNPSFSHPCVDWPGIKPWQRIRPVDFALHLRALPNKKPDFPGVQDRRVAAACLERALADFSRRNNSPNT